MRSLAAASNTRVRLALLVAALVTLKGTLLAVDPTIRLYLGDSAAFLYGAMDKGRLPDDRSFTYSFLLRWLIYPFLDLSRLALWQTAAGVVVALLLWFSLEKRFGIPRGVAAAAAFILALEPAQLFYERMVLAETFGLTALVLFFCASAAYLARPASWWWLPLVAALGLLAATLRLNYLPVVLVVSLVLPFLPMFDRRSVVTPTRIAHIVIATAAVAALHGSYCYAVGQIFGVRPGYLGRAGFMQLGLVLPLVKPTHLVRVGLPPDIEDRLDFPLASADARMAHLWGPGGLVRELRRRNLDVESIARSLSELAIADNPLGVVYLGVHTVGDYFRGDRIRHALDNDLGRRRIPEDILWSLREEWGYDARDVPTRATLVSRWFEHTTWWLVLCLFVLIPAAAWNVLLHWGTELRVHALLAALFAAALVLSHVLFVPVAFYRYLHPLPFFVLLNVVPARIYLPFIPHSLRSFSGRQNQGASRDVWSRAPQLGNRIRQSHAVVQRRLQGQRAGPVKALSDALQ